MNKPQENEYDNYVAYCRALEEYCEALQVEVASRDLVIKQMREALSIARFGQYLQSEVDAIESVLALQPSTEALDAYVTEKVEKQAAALKVAKIALLELHYSNSTDIAEALYQKAIRQINELGV